MNSYGRACQYGHVFVCVYMWCLCVCVRIIFVVLHFMRMCVCAYYFVVFNLIYVMLSHYVAPVCVRM